jgi:iduronate 2-sulfatase
MWCKHTNYEQAARIPLIVAAPGVGKPGSRARNALVASVDLYPTLAELAGLPAPKVPQGIDGQSFVAAMKDPAAAPKEAIFHAYPRGERIGRAVRTARHRLVEWKVPGADPDSAEIELYDYEADPQETKNLAATNPRIVKQLRALLAAQPEAKRQITVARPLTAKQKRDRTDLFQKKDANGDNQLTREEFLTGQSDPAEAPKRFVRFDTNKDGMLSRDEFIFMGNLPKR